MRCVDHWGVMGGRPLRHQGTWPLRPPVGSYHKPPGGHHLGGARSRSARLKISAGLLFHRMLGPCRYGARNDVLHSVSIWGDCIPFRFSELFPVPYPLPSSDLNTRQPSFFPSPRGKVHTHTTKQRYTHNGTRKTAEFLVTILKPCSFRCEENHDFINHRPKKGKSKKPTQ